MEDRDFPRRLAQRPHRAPCLFDGPINGACFHAYVEQFLVPTLKPGDVVILDNLGSHKGKAVRKAIRDVGARLVFLPKYSPDLNPHCSVRSFFALSTLATTLARSRRASRTPSIISIHISNLTAHPISTSSSHAHGLCSSCMSESRGHARRAAHREKRCRNHLSDARGVRSHRSSTAKINHLRQRHRLRPARPAQDYARHDDLVLRRLCLMAKRRHRTPMDAYVDGCHATWISTGHPTQTSGDRPHDQPHPP